jgi:hypothetical protein
MYLASATLKRYESEGRKAEDAPLMHWAIWDCMFKAQNAFEGVIANFPNRLFATLLRRIVVFPLGRPYFVPSDRLGHEVARLQDALEMHEPLPFVLATGEYKGEFVVTEISVTSEQTDLIGTQVSVEASVSLKEHVPPPGVGFLGQSCSLACRKTGIPLSDNNLHKTCIKCPGDAGKGGESGDGEWSFHSP